MKDPFLSYAASARKASAEKIVSHAERAHSKFSASGAERWFNCPGSVKASEGLPDRDSPWSIEGTLAHEVLEATLRAYSASNPRSPENLNAIHAAVQKARAGLEELVRRDSAFLKVPLERAILNMVDHAHNTASFISNMGRKIEGSVILVETRVYLDFIHPEAFGTFDGAIVDQFGTLHVFDYKYGVSPVSPNENLQMLFYALALAHQYQWNFKRVGMWIDQPRVRGYQGPLYWEISLARLLEYRDIFRGTIERVEREPDRFVEGPWCHWCKAKPVCPLKQEDKIEKAISVFGSAPLDTFKGETHGIEKDSWEEDVKGEGGDKAEFVSEADWRKANRKRIRKAPRKKRTRK